MHDYSLRTHGHPDLAFVCQDVTEANAKEAHELSLAMVAELQNHNEKAHYGVGLASTQVGGKLRVIVLRTDVRNPDKVDLCFNPTWKPTVRLKKTLPEGCLSFPGARKQVERFQYIEVKYLRMKYDPTGLLKTEFEEVTASMSDFKARVFQHECDHLDGICKVGQIKQL